MIHCVDDLVDALSSDSGPRVRELASIELRLQSTNKLVGLDRRAGVALAYAHWEGFVKHAACAYVALVARKSRRLGDLSANFQALACRGILVAAQSAVRRIRPHVDVVSRLVDGLASSVTLPTDGAIDTESNLNAEVFENLCSVVGIDYDTNWRNSGRLMDSMFTSRCLVAHGALYTPEHQHTIECIRFSKQAIRCFTADIENAALTQAYLRPAARTNRLIPVRSLPVDC